MIRIAGVLVACLLLAGCQPATGETPAGTPTTDMTKTPLATGYPNPSPIPLTALHPDLLWVAVDGQSQTIALISAAGNSAAIQLPLNEGQLASNVVASRNGNALAYLVWNAEGRQHGIATWQVGETNAHLIARPAPGYRIVALFLSHDGEQLVFVQVAEGERLADANWRLEVIPTSGGESEQVAGSEAFEGDSVMVPFAWPAEGPILLSDIAPDVSSQGVYALDAGTGAHRQVVPAEGGPILAPVASPGGGQLAYLVAGSESANGEVHSMRVLDLRLDETMTLTPPDGQTIASARWHPDGERLLLDIVTSAPDDPGQVYQYWALAQPGDAPPWSGTVPGPGRENLFDYRPYRNGVVYSLLPVDEEWEMYMLPDLTEPTEAQRVSLQSIAQETGAPVIIYVPDSDS